jgi:hypothetical protein
VRRSFRCSSVVVLINGCLNISAITTGYHADHLGLSYTLLVVHAVRRRCCVNEASAVLRLEERLSAVILAMREFVQRLSIPRVVLGEANMMTVSLYQARGLWRSWLRVICRRRLWWRWPAGWRRRWPNRRRRWHLVCMIVALNRRHGLLVLKEGAWKVNVWLVTSLSFLHVVISLSFLNRRKGNSPGARPGRRRRPDWDVLRHRA